MPKRLLEQLAAEGDLDGAGLEEDDSELVFDDVGLEVRGWVAALHGRAPGALCALAGASNLQAGGRHAAVGTGAEWRWRLVPGAG